MSLPELSSPTVGNSANGTRGATPPAGAGDPLDLLLGHLRELISSHAAAFLAIDAEHKSIEVAAEWFASPAVRDAIEPALRRPAPSELPVLVEAAMGRGSPLFLPRIEDWQAAPRLRSQFGDSGGEAGGDPWSAFARSSVIACPVRTAIGRTLGVLVVASLEPALPLRKADLRLVEVLADLAALALERSQLLAAEAARARQELLLKRAAEDMSRSLESGDVYLRVVEHATSVTGADHGLLSRLIPDASRLVTAAESGAGGEAAIDQAPPREVARTRTPLVGGPGDRSMHAPVALGPRLFGVLSVARQTGPAFGQQDLELLGELARLAAAAMANAIDFERERRIAQALTRGFVPDSLPEVAGYELGVRSEPADSQPTGGDLYGVWALPSGEVAVLVGDVAGKGVETAALSAMARFFIEARSWDCSGPAEVLAQANTMLRGRLPSDTFVTAFFALLTPRGLRCASAGHLSPLLLRRGGELEEVAATGLPLGIERGPDFSERLVEFGPGDLMVAFTDGLLEARRAGELFGPERFASLVKEAGARAGDLDQLVRLVHDGVHEWGHGLSDDAVLLAVRRRG